MTINRTSTAGIKHTPANRIANTSFTIKPTRSKKGTFVQFDASTKRLHLSIVYHTTKRKSITFSFHVICNAPTAIWGPHLLGPVFPLVLSEFGSTTRVLFAVIFALLITFLRLHCFLSSRRPVC
jgi:hypothetical protein